MTITLDDIDLMDADDVLRFKRDAFQLPSGVIYLDGNSLGCLPLTVQNRLEALVLDEWGEGLIKSWNAARWIDLPQAVGAKIARLVGARADEVVAADSTSINLYKAVAAALSLRPGRRRIVTEQGNFPTDNYIMQGLADLLPDVRVDAVPVDQIEAALGDDTAVLCLTHVHYRTGRIHDMAALTARAHEAGALMVWDLSHSTGAMPVDLNKAGADFAVGCGYKFLNGGPGAPAYIYVARRHQTGARSPLWGWLGHAEPFAFTEEFIPDEGMLRMTCGSPPVISMAALGAALDVFEDVDMKLVRAKSLALIDLFIELSREQLADYGFEIVAEADHNNQGSQVGLIHKEGYAIMQALISHCLIGDYREPGLLRFGITPLYLSYRDIWDAVDIIRTVMKERAWKLPEFQQRKKVT